MHPVPGWYADPYGAAPLRWWDGVRWTESTQGAGAGWHPDPEVAGRLRWWDGVRWGDDVAEGAVVRHLTPPLAAFAAAAATPWAAAAAWFAEDDARPLRPLAVTAHSVFVAVAGRGLAVLDSESGQVRWRALADTAPPVALRATGPDLLVQTADGAVRLLDPGKGEVRWTWEVPGGRARPTDSAGLLLAGDRALILAGTDLWALDLASGSERFIVEGLRTGTAVTAVVCPPVVAVALADGTVTAVALADGERRWVTGRRGFDDEGRFGVRDLVAAAADAVFVAGRSRAGGWLDARAASDGERRWTRAFGAASSAVVASGCLVAAEVPRLSTPEEQDAADPLLQAYRAAFAHSDPVRAAARRAFGEHRLVAVDVGNGSDRWAAAWPGSNPRVVGESGRLAVLAFDTDSGHVVTGVDAHGGQPAPVAVLHSGPLVVGPAGVAIADAAAPVAALLDLTAAPKAGAFESAAAVVARDRWAERRRWEAAVPATALAVAGDLLLAAADDALVGIEPADGGVRWSLTLPVERAHQLKAVAAGTVVVVVLEGEVLAVDAATGALRWQARSDAAVELAAAGPLVLLAGGAATGGRRVVVVDAASGGRRWDALGRYVAADARVAVVGLEDAPADAAWAAYDPAGPRTSSVIPRLRCIEVRGGAVRWTLDAPAVPAVRPDALAAAVDAAPRPVAVSGDTVLAWAFGGLAAIDLEYGARRWSHPLATHMSGAAVAVAGDLIVAATPDGLVGLRRDSGRQLWSAALAAPAGWIAVAADGMLAACGGPAITTLDATGSVQRRRPLPPGTLASVPLPDGGAAVADGAGIQRLDWGA